MNQDNFSTYVVVAVVFISGFAIQQALQILDPPITGAIDRYKKSRLTRSLPALPGGMADADFKKAVMALLSFVLGLVVVLLTGIRLLAYIKVEWKGFGDMLVTALVVGSGTDAANTVLKFLGYVKDAQKPVTEVEVTIIPGTALVAKNSTLQLRADVKNSPNKTVEWHVLQGAGGSITQEGLYTASATPGTFQIIAISKVDSTRSALATITVV
jgi:hypothetical protein